MKGDVGREWVHVDDEVAWGSGGIKVGPVTDTWAETPCLALSCNATSHYAAPNLFQNCALCCTPFRLPYSYDLGHAVVCCRRVQGPGRCWVWAWATAPASTVWPPALSGRWRAPPRIAAAGCGTQAVRQVETCMGEWGCGAQRTAA